MWSGEGPVIGELSEVWWSVGWSDLAEVGGRDLGFIVFTAVFFVLITVACFRRAE